MKTYLKESIMRDKEKLRKYKIFSGKEDRLLRMKTQNGKKHYYIRDIGEMPGKYIPKDEMESVYRIQRNRFAKAMCQVIKSNIQAKERLLEELKSDDPQDVMNSLPKAYQMKLHEDEGTIHESENPYRREDLNIKTSFGLMVRSRVEAIIAEMLYSYGVEFYYEKALTIQSVESGYEKTYYPDFTILLPDGEVIYWEHEGLLVEADYAKRWASKLQDYTGNGIIQSRNLIVTSEGWNNDFSIEDIKRAIEGWILPKSKGYF